ncbi:uncharacterized protein LOC126752795 [Bactrocera neohumeralis]|uniref:uncharacterized protein LOC126752795 n=1 Tax=Bactrocera neohumeralis TaxID=98809 RepID=UPI002165F0D8|nr:uncharacterized protein LOC126752795 [Bactrocera neohumeralis]
MGAPELPGDPGEEDVHAIQTNVQHPPVPSDDSDNEMNTLDAYNGYQPLATGNDVNELNDVSMDDNDSIDEDSEETVQYVDNVNAVENAAINDNLPPVESADAEIERQVWSQPRPHELQLELDNNKTTQILNVMANITLPNAVVPEWANGVPEERWKAELLERIRQRGVARQNDDK